MLLIWGYDQSRRLRHNGTTGKLRMTRMRDLPVPGKSVDARHWHALQPWKARW
jgi:hypothetical protein